MRRIARVLFAVAAAISVACAISIALTTTDPDLYPGDGPVIHVVDHGYHSGILIRQSDLRRAAIDLERADGAKGDRLRWLASRFPDAPWVEIGWGDAAFYQVTPTIGDVDLWLGLRALLWPTDSVLQVVPIYARPDDAFGEDKLISLRLTDIGFARLAQKLAGTIPERLPRPIGPSLYGAGLFYAAALDYHLFRTCNHWISSLLRAAGVPSGPVLGTFSASLMQELRWRL
ncbi:MAG: DUF2459 domain-containing protein [Pseudomonadota bacterium]